MYQNIGLILGFIALILGIISFIGSKTNAKPIKLSIIAIVASFICIIFNIIQQ